MDENKKEKWKTYIHIGWRLLGAVGFLAMPTVSFVLFEDVTGNLEHIVPLMCRLNVLWYYVVYLVVFGILGTSRLTVPAASGFFYALSLAEAFVMEYRGSPILPADLLAAQTAATVIGNYRLELSPVMQHAGWILLTCNLLLLTAPVRVRGWKQRLGAAVGCIGGAVGLGMYFYLLIVPAYQLTMNLWELAYTYNANGYVLATAVSMQYMVKKPPKGYSQAVLENIYARIMAEDEEREEYSGEVAGEEIQPVNLICIMNESLSDLKVAGDFTASEEYFPFLKSLTENTVKGSLAITVFGSGTSSSEYEFLTGNSMALLPVDTNPYQFYVPPQTRSLVSTLKDQGYRAVAMHPYPGENWNRDVSYENMGFDEFLCGDYFDNLETFRTFISDRADYQKIIELVEQKEDPQEKLFVFNVTMQNHGGYEIQDLNLKARADIRLTGKMAGKYPMADQYLSLMKLSDEALEYLLGYFSESAEPTMIVMFGDHQPSVEDTFWDEIAGCPSDQVSMEGPTSVCPYQEMILEYQYMEYNHSLDKRTMNQLFEIPEQSE